MSKGDKDRGDPVKRSKSNIYCQRCGKTRWCCECSNHPGVKNDELIIASIPEDERCLRCDGSGNEFYYKYKQCSACLGTGRKLVDSTNPVTIKKEK